jgi:hypothetical protein
MNNLNSVKEEPEGKLIDHMSSPRDEGLEIKQLDSFNSYDESHHNTVNGKVLKNNYLMSTNPTGTYKTLEIKTMADKPPNGKMMMTMPKKDDADNIFVRRNHHVDHNRILIEDQKIHLPDHNEVKRPINENFEINSNGMMKMKKNQEQIFMKNRYAGEK